MKCDPITIPREDILEYSDNIPTIIRNREYSQIVLNLEWYTVRFEPFSTLSGREFPHRFPYEFPSSSIFHGKDFLILDTRRHIAPTTTRNDDLFTRWDIFLEKMNMEVDSLWFENCRRCHESCSSCSDDCNPYHTRSIERISENPKNLSEERD